MDLPPDPAVLIDDAWRRLARGAADRRSPFHTPLLATIGLDGRPRARTVVLRGFDAADRVLRVHADARSAKVSELGRDPRVSLVFYDPGARLQVRVEGEAGLHRGDAVARDAWQRSQPMSRACYAARHGPGEPVDAPPSAPERSGEGFEHFTVIRCRLVVLDVLSLSRDGHRRAEAVWVDGRRAIRWLAP